MNNQIRIAFTGPESSGKTTLSLWLSQQIDAIYCEEYAREFLEGKSDYSQKDLTEIATGQAIIWERATKEKHLVADTEMTVIEIWSHWKYQDCDPIISNLLLKQKFDLIFLCKPDIPWEFDPLRESENDREKLFQLYIERLTNLNFNFLILDGKLEKRKKDIQNELKKWNISF